MSPKFVGCMAGAPSAAGDLVTLSGTARFRPEFRGMAAPASALVKRTASGELRTPGREAYAKTQTQTAGHQHVRKAIHDSASRSLFIVWGLALAACSQHTKEPAENVVQTKSALWTSSNLNDARRGHAATALDANHVLICGGEVGFEDLPQVIDSCELYDASSGQWQAGSWPVLPSARRFFTLTALDSENVLLVGGMTHEITAIGNAQVGSAAQGWSTQESIVARWGHTASLLANGAVLIAGGVTRDENDNLPQVTEVELRTPSGTWYSVGTFAAVSHSATVLAAPGPNGPMEVALIGGTDPLGLALDAVHVFSLHAGATAGTWRQLQPLPGGGRYAHTSTLLANGDVLVVGGIQAMVGPAQQAYRYDHADEEWKPAGLAHARANHMAARLGSRVVIAGGSDINGQVDVIEVYDPERDPLLHPESVPAGTNPWTALPALNNLRYDATMTPVLNDTALLVAGGTDDEQTWKTSELIQPLELGAPCGPDSACASGYCADGVCCNQPCNGSCQACNQAGYAGSCVPIDGMPKEGHPSCSSGESCVAGACFVDCHIAGCDGADYCAGDGQCMARRGYGGYCEHSGMCQQGLSCEQQICASTAYTNGGSSGSAGMSGGGSSGAEGGAGGDGNGGDGNGAGGDGNGAGGSQSSGGSRASGGREAHERGGATNATGGDGSERSGGAGGDGAGGDETSSPAHCAADERFSIHGDGSREDCAPYTCAKETGQCRNSCEMSEQCSAPNLCDPHGTCRPLPPATPGSCALNSIQHTSSRGAGWFIGTVLALGAAWRRRERRTLR